MINFLKKTGAGIRAFAESRLGILSLVLILGFWLAAYLTEFAPLNLAITSLYFTVALGVTAAYAREAFNGFVSRSPSRGQVLAMGIFLSWFSIDLTRISGFFYRFSGNDDRWIHHDGLTFFFFLSAIAGILHLLAPRDADPNPDKPYKPTLLGILLVAATGLGFVLGQYY